MENKKVDEKLLKKGVNEFNFTTPATNREITFKLLTHGDEAKINQEVTGLKKINKEASPELSTRLKHMLISVDGETDRKKVRDFVDKEFLAIDSRAFRKHIETISPDMDLKFYPENGPAEGVSIPIGVTFLWPDADI